MVRDPFKGGGSVTLPQDFYFQLRNWILEVEQELQSLRTEQGVAAWSPECGVSAPLQSAGKHDPGAFPFRVMFKNSGPHLSEKSEELIVCGCHTATDNETESLIFGGPGQMKPFDEVTLSVSGTGYIYLIVNLDGESEDYLSAHVEFLTSAYYPTPTVYLVLLAQIGRTPCGFMTITQLHCGHVYITGRIV